MERLDLSQRRDFGDLFSATFKYVIDNAGSLLKAVILYAGPIYLIQGILTSLAFGKFLKQLSSGFTPTSIEEMQQIYMDMFSELPMWSIPAMIITSVAGYLMLIGLVNNHIILYAQGEDVENMDLLRNGAVQSMMGNLGLIVIQTLIFIGLALAAGLLIAIGIAIDSVAVSVILGIVAMVGVYYVLFAFYLSYMAREYEQLGAIDAIRRSFTLIKGHWWQTFFLAFLVGLLGGIVANVVSAILGSFDPTDSAMITNTVQILVSMVGSTFVWVAMGIQYFNLYEGAVHNVLDDKIDQIGQDGDGPIEEF